MKSHYHYGNHSSRHLSLVIIKGGFMKASHFLICLSAFTVILACDSNTDIRLAQTFTFAVNMQGSDQRPDPDFETLVKTHMRDRIA